MKHFSFLCFAIVVLVSASAGHAASERDAGFGDGANNTFSALTDQMLKIRVDVSPVHWNTYALSADVNHQDGVTVEWTFGDGKTGRGAEVTHAFLTAGRYVVSAVATSEQGERAQQKIPLDISFWHIGNWQLWTLFATLGGLMWLLIASTRIKKEKEEEPVPSISSGHVPSLAKPARSSGTKRVRRPVKKRTAKPRVPRAPRTRLPTPSISSVPPIPE